MEGLSSHPPIPVRFERSFKAKSADGYVMSFADFMALALYDEEVGYYAAQRERIGRGSGSDFYTAASLQPVFGRLVGAATVELLGHHAAAEYTFVEIGAEPGRCVLDGCEHPFAEVVVVRQGDPLTIPPRAVMFSNELFDAQPFHRITWEDGAWTELGVQWTPAGLGWTTLNALSPEVAAITARLPAAAPEGYIIDLPIRAETLVAELATAPWQGLFVAFDYGRTWNELVSDYSRGTGRAYAAHQVSGDLLQTPGEQDLTCHVCWDWLENALTNGGFGKTRRVSQESFFVHHASSAIASIVGAGGDPLAHGQSQLRGLLHAGLMGQRFEVLMATREAADQTQL